MSKALEVLADEMEESPRSTRTRERAQEIRELASIPPPGRISREFGYITKSLPTTWPGAFSLTVLIFGVLAYFLLK